MHEELSALYQLLYPSNFRQGNTMAIEALLTELIAALNANTAAQTGKAAVAAAAAKAKTDTPAAAPKTDAAPAAAEGPKAVAGDPVFDKVRKPFLDLVAKDSTTASKILGEYGAAKLSAIPHPKWDEVLVKITAALGAGAMV